MIPADHLKERSSGILKTYLLDRYMFFWMDLWHELGYHFSINHQIIRSYRYDDGYASKNLIKKVDHLTYSDHSYRSTL